MKRITDTKLYGNTYTLGEYMQDLNDAMFKDDMKSNVSTFRQNLQEYYVERLIQIIKPDAAQYDEPSQAAAMHSLKDIQTFLAKAKSTDALTQVHRDHLTLQIQRALSVKG